MWRRPSYVEGSGFPPTEIADVTAELDDGTPCNVVSTSPNLM